jgi:hypothetical protein
MFQNSDGQRESAFAQFSLSLWLSYLLLYRTIPLLLKIRLFVIHIYVTHNCLSYTRTFFFFGATAPILALAYLHEIFHFTSVY